ncbi:hypothetical protein CerSpe_001910 [Prunus speciosa]
MVELAKLISQHQPNLPLSLVITSSVHLPYDPQIPTYFYFTSCASALALFLYLPTIHNQTHRPNPPPPSQIQTHPPPTPPPFSSPLFSPLLPQFLHNQNLQAPTPKRTQNPQTQPPSSITDPNPSSPYSPAVFFSLPLFCPPKLLNSNSYHLELNLETSIQPTQSDHHTHSPTTTNPAITPTATPSGFSYPLTLSPSPTSLSTM